VSHSRNNPTRLVVAIGNTHVRCAACRAGQLRDKRCIETTAVLNGAEALRPLVEVIEQAECSRAVVLSVVPAALKAVREYLGRHSDIPVVVVREEIPLPMPMNVEAPEQVGADRLCAAAAGYERAKQACVVVDFGTAITINAVSDDGVFLGGAILPGVGLGARALADFTAALPRIEVEEPGTALGVTTEKAMQSGLVFGARGAVREVVEQIATQFGKWPYCVFTGGDAALIGARCDFVDAVVPDLGLLGLELADRLHLESEP
jgi:type III pantothenate kinase